VLITPISIPIGCKHICIGEFFSVWDSYDLSKYELGTGPFSQDARGRWHFNSTVKIEAQSSEGRTSIGIDLGLKTAATCSGSVVF
jgi:transposase